MTVILRCGLTHCTRTLQFAQILGTNHLLLSDITSFNYQVITTCLGHDMIIQRQNFDTNQHYNLSKKYEVHWNDNVLKCITVKDIWIRHEGTIVNQVSSVWHKLGEPRYSFHHWLIMHGRVSTLTKLQQYDIIDNISSYFCNNGTKIIQHIFLECPYM